MNLRKDHSHDLTITLELYVEEVATLATGLSLPSNNLAGSTNVKVTPRCALLLHILEFCALSECEIFCKTCSDGRLDSSNDEGRSEMRYAL